MAPHPNEDLIVFLESFRNALISRATGGGGFDAETVFVQGRRTLIEHPELSKVIPRWIKSCRNLDDFWGMIKQAVSGYQPRRDWIRAELEPAFDLLEGRTPKPADESINERLKNSGSAYVHEAWQKALARREQDPDGAITSARTLLEEVCRFVLDEQGEAYDDKAELPKLYGLASKTLNLAPSQHTEDIFKQVLGGCHSIVVGLGSLRSKIGDAHAKGRVGVRPAPRHAAFAVNVAGATASFLLDTYEARKKEASLR